MKKLVKQIIVDREKRIAQCVINPLGQAKQNSIFENLRCGQFIGGRQLGHQKILVSENQPIDAQQLRSSLVAVPPMGFVYYCSSGNDPFTLIAEYPLN